MRNNVLKTIVVCLVSMCFVFSSRAAGLSAKLVNPQHGPATVQGEDSTYYYFKGRIETSAETNLVFRTNTCVLVGKDDEKYTNCWIHLSSWCAGLDETKTAPVSMKTLSVLEGTTGAKPASQWNTSKADGEKGSITYRIPKGGFVELYFLWQVPKGFEPKRMILTDLLDLAL